jgi:preprotein translocase subunit SecG
VQQILLVVHLLIAIALVAVVLMQRSEGGGLGIGGGGGGGLPSARGSGSFLTRITAILAAAFMGMSLVLAILAGTTTAPGTIVDEGPAPAPVEGTAPDDSGPAIPLSE